MQTVSVTKRKAKCEYSQIYSGISLLFEMIFQIGADPATGAGITGFYKINGKD